MNGVSRSSTNGKLNLNYPAVRSVHRVGGAAGTVARLGQSGLQSERFVLPLSVFP